MFSSDLDRSTLFQGLRQLDWVARFLEKETRHLTRQLRLWNSATQCQPPLSLGQSGFGLGGSGSSGFIGSQLGMDNPSFGWVVGELYIFVGRLACYPGAYGAGSVDQLHLLRSFLFLYLALGSSTTSVYSFFGIYLTLHAETNLRKKEKGKKERKKHTNHLLWYILSYIQLYIF